MSTDIILSKAQISKIIQSGGFTSWSINESSCCCSAIEGAIQMKINVSGTTNLIMSNEETNDIMKIVQTLEDSNILLKESLKQLKIKQKNKNEDSLVCY